MGINEKGGELLRFSIVGFTMVHIAEISRQIFQVKSMIYSFLRNKFYSN